MPKNRRKIKVIGTILLLAVLVLPIFVQANETQSVQKGVMISFVVGETQYTLHDDRDVTTVKMDARTFIENGRVYVPVRYLANSLGILNELIAYEQSTQTVVFDIDPIMFMDVDHPYIFVGQNKKEIDVAPIIRDGRIYLPARFVAEELGWEVSWDDELKSVNVKQKVEEIKVQGGFIEAPSAIKINGKTFYEFEDVLVKAGFPKNNLTKEGNDAWKLKNNFYQLIMVEDGSSTIYLIDIEGNSFKYDLTRPINYRNKWVIEEQDLMQMGMLGTILQFGGM